MSQNLPSNPSQVQANSAHSESHNPQFTQFRLFFQAIRTFLKLFAKEAENKPKLWFPFRYMYRMTKSIYSSQWGKDPQKTFYQFLSSFGQLPDAKIIIFDKTCIATDETVNLVEGFLPRERGIKRHPLKYTLTAILLLIKHGLPYRAIPPQLGNWHTIHGFMWRMSQRGLWEEILSILVSQSNEVDTSLLAVDTFYCKCTREACSLYVKDKDRGIGKSKGGHTAKAILTCDKNLRPIDFDIVPGNTNDAPMGYQAIERLKKMQIKAPGALLFDKGFDSKRTRKEAQEAGFKPYIPHRQFPKYKGKPQESKELQTLISLVKGTDQSTDLLEDKERRGRLLSFVSRVAGKQNEKSWFFH